MWLQAYNCTRDLDYWCSFTHIHQKYSPYKATNQKQISSRGISFLPSFLSQARHKAHRVALTSISLGLSQTPVYTVRP